MKPFKVYKFEEKDSAYEHMSDYVRPTRIARDEDGEPIIPKSNIKVGGIPPFFQQINYQQDEYERKRCIDRFEDMKKKAQVSGPFKCPKSHTYKTQFIPREEIIQFGKVVLQRDLNNKIKQAKDETVKQRYIHHKANIDNLFKLRPKSVMSETKRTLESFKNIDKYKKLLKLC